ncbi:MAG: hypothetical protein ACM3VY_00440, partial [Candidatus Bathyarchaeota archaeon]
MNRFRQLSLASKLAALAAAIVLVVTAVLATVVNGELTRFALANAQDQLRGQTESIRALLDLAYDSEHARAEHALQQASGMYGGRLERRDEMVTVGESTV